MKRFNLMLYEYHTPSVEKLREMQALAVIEALNKGVFDFAPTPSQQEKDQVSQEFQSGFLPCDFEVTEDFRKAYTKFRRFAEKKDPMMIINYKRYGKYIQNHYYDFSDDQRYAIFELDMMLNLIHKEMVSRGGMTSTIMDTKLVVRKALDKRASGIIMVHNHPSGNPRPGKADITMTAAMKRAAATFDISLLDHIIVCDDSCFSFSDERVYMAGDGT